MGERQLPKYIQDLLDGISKEQGFVDYVIESTVGSKAGDGFMSDITSVTISERNSDKKLQLVCKVAPENKNRRKEFISDVAFGREVLFYGKVMPLFAEYQKQKGVPEDDQFLAYPKCYAALADDEKEQYVLIFEDLRPKDFKMWNKAKPSSIENASLTMRELGKFHGLSLAMKRQNPEKFAPFKDAKDICLNFFESQNMTEMVISSYDRAIEFLKLEEHKNIYRDIKKDVVGYFKQNLSEDAARRFGVMSHGDFWNNNLLFKFNEKNIAEDIRLLDWQLFRYASPAVDILYNIFSCTDKPLRDKEYYNLLHVYHTSLSNTIKLLGSNPDELFTFSDLEDELKRYGNHALLLTPMLLQVSLAESSEIKNLDAMCDDMADGDSKQEMITGLSDGALSEYGRRINEVVEDITRLGYYHKLS